MRFDWRKASDVAEESRATVDEKFLPMIADGVHTATIRWAGEQQDEKAIHEDNPSGRKLTLKLDFGPQWRPAWPSVPMHWWGKIEQVCRSARVPAPSRGQDQDWDERRLVGQVVCVKTVLSIVKDTGREYTRIEEWKPGPPVVELPKVERRTLPQKAAAEVRANVEASGDGDDAFPF